LRFRNDIFPHRYALRARIVVLGYFMRGSVVLVIVTDKRGRRATNDGMHPVAVWPSPSLPKNTEVLRDPLPLRAHVPWARGQRKGAGDLKRKTQSETLRSVFGGVGLPSGVLREDRRRAGHSPRFVCLTRIHVKIIC
jgi:hypothetical protein